MQIEPRALTSECNRIINILLSEVAISKAFRISTSALPKKINAKKFKAIWDTGATNTVITRKVVQECSLEPTGVVEVHDIRGKHPANTYLVNVVLPSRVMFRQLRVTEGKVFGPADVLIGMDIITRGDLAVSNWGGKTTFSYRVPSLGRIDFVKQIQGQKTLKVTPKVGRNDPCPCGSGKKYKHCCLGKSK